MVEESAETTATDPPPANAAEKSDKDAQIIQQVEYYFGDVNLPRDKFLLEEIKADDGWIPLETMIKFKRLAQITTDFGEIIAALKKSDSGLLEMDSEKNKIRRSPHVPLPEMNEERRKALTARSAYVGRFPQDLKIDKILEFCGKVAPDYESVVMRHYHDKAENKWNFKGSIYILFKSVDACKKFIEGEEIEYNGEKLKKIWQKDYLEEKRRERIEERKNKKKGAKNGAENKEGKPEANKSDDEEEEESEFPLGAVVNLTGFKDNSKTKREEIKAKIEGYGIAVAFIDFNVGEQAAWVRMEQKDAAKELAKKVAEEGETMKVNDDELTVRVLEGEEEEQYLVKAKETKLKRRNNAKFNKKGGRGRGRGGRRGGGGRGRWKRSGSPNSRNDNKRQKTE